MPCTGDTESMHNFVKKKSPVICWMSYIMCHMSRHFLCSFWRFFFVFLDNVCCLRQNFKLKLHYHCNMRIIHFRLIYACDATPCNVKKGQKNTQKKRLDLGWNLPLHPPFWIMSKRKQIFRGDGFSLGKHLNFGIF